MSTPKPAAKMAGRKVYDAAELAQYAEGLDRSSAGPW